MAKDEEKSETIVAESQLPNEAFLKAEDAIKAEKQAEAEKQETETKSPAGDEVDTDVISEPESPEVDVSAETDTEQAEAADLKGIDEDVLDVCRDFYDDKEIIELAKNKPELLEAIREELDRPEKEPVKTPAKEEKAAETKELKAEFEELKFNLDPDIVGQDIKNAMDSIAARFNVTGKKLAEMEKNLTEERNRLQSERDAVFNNRIDACFDRHAKDLFAEAKKAGQKVPTVDLGQSKFYSGKSWKQLGRQERQQVQKRNEIFALATRRAEIRNIPIEKAIEIEINREKNQDGEKAAEQRLLNKMQTEEKRFTSPPTRRLSSPKHRTFANEADEMEYRMMTAEQEAGLE